MECVNKHNIWMNETINLIASENRLSPIVENILKSDFNNRVAEGWIGERLFPGLKYYDEIEKYGIKVISKMFNADFVDLRPISGTMANMVIYSAFTKPGDDVLSISISSGAHISMAGSLPKKVFHLKMHYLSFNNLSYKINLKDSIKLIHKIKPKLLILGGSVLLFPQPIKKLSIEMKKIGGLVLFDASHVAGLIAGGVYPNPLDEGADIMTLTTCKTIPGPQHAFILAKDKFADIIKKTTFPSFLSGHHLHETVASIVAMEEFRQFGKAYAKQVVRNSKALANELDKLGFKIIGKNNNFTETHMFLIDISNILSADKAEKILELSNIIANKNILANDKSFLRPSGLRIGTPEITRLGMADEDMKKVASFIYRALILKENPEIIKRDVKKYMKKFQKIRYCFN